MGKRPLLTRNENRSTAKFTVALLGRLSTQTQAAVFSGGTSECLNKCLGIFSPTTGASPTLLARQSICLSLVDAAAVAPGFEASCQRPRGETRELEAGPETATGKLV